MGLSRQIYHVEVLYMYHHYFLRYYLNKMDMKRCTRNTDEREVCMTKILDCEAAVSAKNFTGEKKTRLKTNIFHLVINCSSHEAASAMAVWLLML